MTEAVAIKTEPAAAEEKKTAEDKPAETAAPQTPDKDVKKEKEVKEEKKEVALAPPPQQQVELTPAQLHEQDCIKRFYEIDQILSANASPENVVIFEELLRVKEAGKAAKLAAQLIPRFLKSYPAKTDDAINALFDLCEDPDDVGTRVQAARAIPQIAQQAPEHTGKLAHVVVQLLQAETPVEKDNIRQSLMLLSQVDVKGVLEALFNHIVEGSELLRARAIEFLQIKLLPSKESLFKPKEEVGQFIANQVKRVMDDVSLEEFRFFMSMLSGLSILSESKDKDKPSLATELVDQLEKNMELTGEFDAKNKEQVEKILGCCEKTNLICNGKLAHPFIGKLLTFSTTKILPVFDQLEETYKLPVLKQLAELAHFLNPDEAKAVLPGIYALLMSSVPMKDATSDKEAPINFSHVECLLIAFHHLSAKAPGFLRGLCGFHIVTGQPSDMSTPVEEEKYADFTKKLTFLSESTEKYNKQAKQRVAAMETNIRSGKSKDTRQDLVMIRLVVRTTDNIKAMAQALLRKPPMFSNNAMGVKPSWKQQQQQQQQKKKQQQKQPQPAASTSTSATAAGKRPNQTEVTGMTPPKRGKQEVYQPPARRSGSGGGGRGVGRGSFGGGGKRGGGRGRGGSGGRRGGQKRPLQH